jgi:hypothetical protein
LLVQHVPVLVWSRGPTQVTPVRGALPLRTAAPHAAFKRARRHGTATGLCLSDSTEISGGGAAGGRATGSTRASSGPAASTASATADRSSSDEDAQPLMVTPTRATASSMPISSTPPPS